MEEVVDPEEEAISMEVESVFEDGATRIKPTHSADVDQVYLVNTWTCREGLKVGKWKTQPRTRDYALKDDQLEVCGNHHLVRRYRGVIGKIPPEFDLPKSFLDETSPYHAAHDFFAMRYHALEVAMGRGLVSRLGYICTLVFMTGWPLTISFTGSLAKR